MASGPHGWPRLRSSAVRLGPSARSALGVLGDALQEPGAPGWAAPMMAGAPVERTELEARVGPGHLVALEEAGLAAPVGSQVVLATTIVRVGDVLTAIPKYPWGDEVVYVGPDSAYLVEAALRLAPRGDRAAELGTGTGLLAAELASRYRTVIATDVAPSVTTAAALTLALNRRPAGHVVGLCVADVAGGLREDAFDLVLANAPWVPLAPDAPLERELFAHGGDTGVELPRRFLAEGARLLRPGGLAVTLALDVELDADAFGDPRPLRSACARLRESGFDVDVLATPFGRPRPALGELMAARQPALVGATHVAVVVGRPRHPGAGRGSRGVAIDALGRRWLAAGDAEAVGA